MKILKILIIVLTLFNQLSAQENSKPAITPYWGFGHWIWEDQLHTSSTIRYMVDGYTQNDIPVNTIIMDSPWSSAYNNFEYDRRLYPDFEALLEELHEKNIKLILWYTGFVNKESREVPIAQSPLYEEAIDRNYTVSNGKLFRWHKGQGAHIDFTNPNAVAWWHRQIDKVLKLGIDGWKVDISAEWLDDRVETSMGNMTNKEFSSYHYKDAFEYARSINPDFFCYTYGHVYVRGRRMDMAPLNYSNGQWTGDYNGDFEGLTNQLEFIYLSADHGYGAPACEIAGFWGRPATKKSFIRYTQLASLVPVMVNGGKSGALGYHLPWNYDDQTIGIYRDYVQLHKQLAPYLFSTSVDGHLNGHSIITSSSFKDRSHLLGENIFVKAITTENDTVQLTFPEVHRWIDFWDITKIYEPSQTIEKVYPLEKYPIFIKEGSILPVEKKGDEWLEFRIFPKDESSYIFHNPVGEGIDYRTLAIEVNEKKGTVKVASLSEQNFKFEVVCFDEPKEVTGADQYHYDSQNSLLTLQKKGKKFKIQIEGLRGY